MNPDKTDLIARLEAASEGPLAVQIALFNEVAWHLGPDCPEDFKRHVSQAMRSGSDTRAQGYLLLAALTLLPEEWRWQIHSHQPRFTVVIHSPDARYETVGPSQGGTYEDRLIAGQDACAIQINTPALALVIACLRARG